MSDNETKELIADDDIEAALAEIEQLSAEEVDKIPSLDDGTDDAAGPPPPRPTPAKTKSAESKKKGTAGASAAGSAPATKAEDEPESAAQPAAPDDALARLYFWTDTALALIDRPVRRFNEPTRKMIGWVSAATLLVALLAALVLPAVFPQRTAITFLQEKSTAFNAAHAVESDSSP